MSARRQHARRQQRTRVAPDRPARRPGVLSRPSVSWPAAWLAIVVVSVAVVLVAERSAHGRSIVSSVQRFLLFYVGVFALIGLTAAVAAGLLATDRVIMRPGSRVVAQAVHRGLSLAALATLAAHIVLEILAHRSDGVDAFVPFLAHRRTLYVGLGTIASDLIVLIIVTGFLRGRFAARHPAAWRGIHAVAYLAWPFAIVHGLMAGRTARPYVDWSYGGCLAAVALALTIRLVVTTRSREEKGSQPVSDRLSGPSDGLLPGARVTMTPLASQVFAQPVITPPAAAAPLAPLPLPLPRATASQPGTWPPAGTRP